MPAPRGATQLPGLCKGQKGQCTTRWMGRGHGAVGFVSYIFGAHPSQCQPPAELLYRRLPGPPLGLPRELTAFEIYPACGFTMPLHLLCNHKYGKQPTQPAPLGRFLPVPFFSGLSTCPHQTRRHRMPMEFGGPSGDIYSVFTLLAEIRGCCSPCIRSKYSLDSQDEYSQGEYSQNEYSYMVLQHFFG